MIPLSSMIPKAANVTVLLQGGHEVELTLRPFNMADYAWFQEAFQSQERQHAISKMRVDVIAEICWHQLDPKSKVIFSNIKYERFNEDTGETEIAEARGHEKLLYALHGEENFWRLFDAYLTCKGINGFATDENDIGLKKKPSRMKQKMKSTGQQRSNSWLRNLVTRQRKS